MREVSEHTKRNNMFFSNYKQAVDDNEIVIDTTSDEYQNSDSIKHFQNVYHQHELRNYSNTSSPQDNRNMVSIEFELLENQFERVLCLDLIASLFEDDTFADFTFIVRGEEFKAHKCLLAKVSEVFRTIFTCGLDETKDNSTKIDCTPAIFRHFLNSIYTNNMPTDIMPEISTELFKLAHCYNIKPMTKVCLDYILEKNIDLNNAFDLYELASAYEVQELLDKTWEFIRIDMLNFIGPCEPKSLKKIKIMLDNKRKYDELKRCFIDDEDNNEDKLGD